MADREAVYKTALFNIKNLEKPKEIGPALEYWDKWEKVIKDKEFENERTDT